MPVKDALSLLSGFLTSQTRLAVTRLRDPAISPSPAENSSGVFTGFFISPAGHLLTAFHPLKHKLWDVGSPAKFELELDFDAAREAGDSRPGPLRVVAVSKPGWSDFKADWAALKLAYEPDAYLPIAAPGHLQPPHVDLCSDVRAYGFTEDQPDVPSLGAYQGQYARNFPQRSQFRMGLVDRGPGQSGGPVIDLRSRTVIGVVSGLYQSRELLTADAALIDQTTLAGLGQEVGLPQLADDWRLYAAQHLSSHLTEFELLATEHTAPPLPAAYLHGRAISADGFATLAGGGACVFLHGPRGSGKTSLATEIVHELSERGLVDSVFWYDFDQAKMRSGDQLIPGLALHIMASQGAFEPLESYSLGRTDEDTAGTISALSTAVRHGRHALVFENVHFPLRDNQSEVLLLLERLVQAAAMGGSKVLLTSWDAPRDPLRLTSQAVEGLGGTEVDEFFRLYGLDLSAKELRYIREYATDIVCLEMFVRSPEWRRAVEAGQSLPREPAMLLSYWVGRYTKEHVPASALSILLALAVLGQPADYEALEEVSAAESFPETLDLLRMSPPLVKKEDAPAETYGAETGPTGRSWPSDLYSAHLNVRRAALAAVDKKRTVETHKRAGDLWERRRDFVSAGRHRLRSGNPEQALALVREHREAIIAAGRIDELEALARELLALSAGFEDGAYALHVVLASCSNIRGDYADATRHWSYALRHAGDNLSMAMLHNRRGDSHRLASEYRSAADDYKLATAAAGTSQAVAYRSELGRALLGLAKLARLRADYRQARQHYGDARDAFDECFDEQGLIETEFGLGEVNRLTRDWTDARNAYSNSLARSQQAGSTEREAYALWGIGEVQRLTEDYERAEKTHQRGREACIRVADTRSEGWALLGLAETYRASGAMDKALMFYEQARDRFLRTKSATEVAHATLGRCEAERPAGRIHLEQYDAAESTYREKGLRHCLVLCCLAKVAALRTAGRAGDGDAYLAEARQLALETGLEHELSVAASMLSDRAMTPFLPLNFP